jgi:hypothetical protein
MRFDVYHHFENTDEVTARLDAIQAATKKLTIQGAYIMSTTQELVALATAAAAEVAKFGPAVDALEAAVTAALAKIPGIPPEAQADIDAAVAALQGVVVVAQAAVADAADGVDEAVVTPPTP